MGCREAVASGEGESVDIPKRKSLPASCHNNPNIDASTRLFTLGWRVTEVRGVTQLTDCVKSWDVGSGKKKMSNPPQHIVAAAIPRVLTVPRVLIDHAAPLPSRADLQLVLVNVDLDANTQIGVVRHEI